MSDATRTDDSADDGDDPVTQREELELDLMEEDASEAGERLGDETGLAAANQVCEPAELRVG